MRKMTVFKAFREKSGEWWAMVCASKPTTPTKNLSLNKYKCLVSQRKIRSPHHFEHEKKITKVVERSHHVYVELEPNQPRQVGAELS